MLQSMRVYWIVGEHIEAFKGLRAIFFNQLEIKRFEKQILQVSVSHSSLLITWLPLLQPMANLKENVNAEEDNSKVIPQATQVLHLLLQIPTPLPTTNSQSSQYKHLLEQHLIAHRMTRQAPVIARRRTVI